MDFESSRLEQYNNATDDDKVKAKRVILKQDPEAHDIIEMLGLGEV